MLKGTVERLEGIADFVAARALKKAPSSPALSHSQREKIGLAKRALGVDEQDVEKSGSHASHVLDIDQERHSGHEESSPSEYSDSSRKPFVIPP